MLKQSVIYILLSILVVLFAKYLHLVILYIDMFFTYLNVQLAPVFSKTQIGTVIRQAVVLVFLPSIIIGTPALAYRAVKGSIMPYFIELIWIVWLIIVLSNILIG